MEDRQLTEHFKLYELTQTGNVLLQDENRRITEEQVSKLTILAELLEQVRELLMMPIIIHSAYRCPKLNKAIGSTDKSQHVKCEAADFSVKGVDLSQTFRTIRQAAKDKKIRFGQLIYEKASRDYGSTEWIHISLGDPYRDSARCGEVLTMNDGTYELIERIT